MEDFIQYIIESTICITFFYLIYRFFLRSVTFYRFNRFFLLGGLLISFILPALNFSYDVLISSPPITFSPEVHIPQTTDIDVQPTSISYSYNIWHIVAAIYIIGITISFIRYIITAKKLNILIKSGTKNQSDKIEYINNESVTTSFTLLKYIFLNDRNLSDTEKNIILNHEKIHIEQKHWIDLLCSECALLLLWFNPIMWLYVLAVKENHEYLVDKTILDRGISRTLYQSVLINQQIQHPVFSFTNSLKMSNHLNRFAMMKKSKSSPWRRLAVLAVLPFIGVFVWASAKPNYVYITEENNLQENTVINNDSIPLKTLFTSTDDKDKVLVLLDGKDAGGEDKVRKDELDLVTLTQLGKDTIIKDKKISTVASITTNKSEFWIRGISSSGISEKALVLVDGIEREMNDVKVDEIESFSILKDESATKIYGEKGKYGVVLITTKSASKKIVKTEKQAIVYITTKGDSANSKPKTELWIRGISSSGISEKALVLVDGIERDMNDVKVDEIESFSILKDESATKIYGEKGKNGVILITTKNTSKKNTDGENVISNIVEKQISGKPEQKDNSEFWIRGVSSFGVSKNALVLVDGIERDMNDVKVDEIKSFSVLKDKSSIKIYGEKGKNGVVLITTKEGEKNEKDKEVSGNSPREMRDEINKKIVEKNK